MGETQPDTHEHEGLLARKVFPDSLSVEDFPVPGGTPAGVIAMIHGCPMTDAALLVARKWLKHTRGEDPDMLLTLNDLVVAYNDLKGKSMSELIKAFGALDSMMSLLIPPFTMIHHLLEAVQRNHKPGITRLHYLMFMVGQAHDLIVREVAITKGQRLAEETLPVPEFPELVAYEHTGDDVMRLLYDVIADQAQLVDDRAIACMVARSGDIVRANFKAKQVDAIAQKRERDTEAEHTQAALPEEGFADEEGVVVYDTTAEGDPPRTDA